MCAINRPIFSAGHKQLLECMELLIIPHTSSCGVLTWHEKQSKYGMSRVGWNSELKDPLLCNSCVNLNWIGYDPKDSELAWRASSIYTRIPLVQIKFCNTTWIITSSMLSNYTYLLPNMLNTFFSWQIKPFEQFSTVKTINSHQNFSF